MKSTVLIVFPSINLNEQTNFSTFEISIPFKPAMSIDPFRQDSQKLTTLLHDPSPLFHLTQKNINILLSTLPLTPNNRLMLPTPNRKLRLKRQRLRQEPRRPILIRIDLRHTLTPRTYIETPHNLRHIQPHTILRNMPPRTNPPPIPKSMIPQLLRRGVEPPRRVKGVGVGESGRVEV